MKSKYLDPRSKLVLFITASMLAFTGLHRGQEIGLFLLVLSALIMCHQLRVALQLGLIFAVMLVLDVFVITNLQGAVQFIAMTICRISRFFLPVMAAGLLVTKTSTMGEYISAFVAMHVPNTVIIPLAVMIRFVPTLKEDWTTINQAMKLRGLSFNFFNVMRRPLLVLEYTMVPFLIHTSFICDELSAAVMARGLDKNRKRTSLVVVRFGWKDYLYLGFTCLFVNWVIIS